MDSQRSNNVPDFVRNPDPYSVYGSSDYVVMDFEFAPSDDELVLACWKYKGEFKYIYGNEYEMGPLLADLAECSFIIAHYTKAELYYLEKCGFDIGSKPTYCTFLAEWVIAGNRHVGLSLADCLERRGLGGKGDLVSTLIKGNVDVRDIPTPWLVKYCLQDVGQTEVLFLDQMDEMEGTRLLPVVYTRCLTAMVLTDIETNGIFLDKERVLSMYSTQIARYNILDARMQELTGGINAASPPQVAEYLYGDLGFEELLDRRGVPIRGKPNKRFPEGMPKTDQLTVNRLRAITHEQVEFLELRSELSKVSASLSKNLDFFRGVVEEGTGLFKGQFNQGRTVTHRLAGAGVPIKFDMYEKNKSVQFQNLPRTMKNLFTTRNKGWYVTEVDGSQLEFRVAGHLGRDPLIKEDIETKVDVHQNTANALTEAGEPTSRQDAKASTFKPLFGGASGSKAVVEYVKFFNARYSALVDTQEAWCNTAMNNIDNMIESEWGLRFYFPNTRRNARGKLVGHQQNFNHFIQSFATGEIIPIALIFFWYYQRDMEMIIGNTVHDSIICEVPPEEVREYTEIATKAMTEDVYDYLNKVYDVTFSINLGAGIKIGRHWSESDLSEEQIDSLTRLLDSKAGYSCTNDGKEISVDVINREGVV